MRFIAKFATAALLGALLAAGAQAQDVVKIGQIEAQTGPNAIYGWMGSQGVPMAVDEINKAGGFKVGDKTYKIELISLDTRGDPKEATIQLKRLLEQDKARFVYGPFLSNVFVTVLPYAKQFNGKFLLMGGATRMHDFVGTPEHDFVIRTWNWDAGPNGFGERMVDYLIKTAGPKKIAMLFQNDQGGKVLGEIYEPHLQGQGASRRSRNISSPAPRTSRRCWRSSPPSRRTTCSPATRRASLRHRAAGDGGQLHPQVLPGARLAGPGHEEQGRHRGLRRLCAEAFRGGREDLAEGEAVRRGLQGILQARFPLRSGAAVLVLLLRPRVHAGRGDAEGRHRRGRRARCARRCSPSPTAACGRSSTISAASRSSTSISPT